MLALVARVGTCLRSRKGIGVGEEVGFSLDSRASELGQEDRFEGSVRPIQYSNLNRNAIDFWLG